MRIAVTKVLHSLKIDVVKWAIFSEGRDAFLTFVQHQILNLECMVCRVL
jgi:hypothetical protein